MQAIHVYIKTLKCITLSISECMVSALVVLPTECNYLLTAAASTRYHLLVLLFFMCLCARVSVDHSVLL